MCVSFILNANYFVSDNSECVVRLHSVAFCTLRAMSINFSDVCHRFSVQLILHFLCQFIEIPC